MHSVRLKFTYVKDLFVQERKESALRSPGQHPNFGATVPWTEIHKHLTPRRKLLLLIRHGEAASNAIQAYVGEKVWVSVAAQCSWKNQSSGDVLQLYDPPLTRRGLEQVGALRLILAGGNVTFRDLTGNKTSRSIVSPLSRTLETFGGVLEDLVDHSSVSVEEFCRERYGHNTCDARRPVSLGLDKAAGPENAQGTRILTSDARSGRKIDCPPQQSLTQKYPNMGFPVTGEDGELGLVSNSDSWWHSNERESDRSIKRRAKKFLARVFNNVKEDVVFVVTHSGMISAILKAMGREGYSAVNAELVPALVEIK